MNIFELTKIVSSLRPNAEFSIDGTKIIWLDKTQSEPTEDEIKESYKNLLETEAAAKAEAAAAKAALLAKLGITEEEAKLLLS